ncbi:MAG: hypothetical protein RR034_05735, partial [Bacteroidales bacterium]
AVVMHGGYKLTKGFMQVFNAAYNMPSASDPEFVTPAGDATKSKTVDNVVDFGIGLIGGKTNVPIIDFVNKLGTVESIISATKSIIPDSKENVQKKATNNSATDSKFISTDKNDRLPADVKNQY